MPTPLRALFLYFVFAAPIALILACLAGPPGALAGAVLSLIVLLSLLWVAEDSISYRFDAEIGVPDGLRRTFELSVAEKDPYFRRVPNLRVYSDPRPQALYARGLRGPGTLYLSRGLLASLTEAEVRAVILEGFSRVTRRGARLVTLCAVLSLAFSRAMPAETEGLTPLRTLWIWMIWPWSGTLDRLSGRVGTPGMPKLCRAAINPWFRLPGDISL